MLSLLWALAARGHTNPYDREINRNQQPDLLFISHSLIKNSLKLISSNFFGNVAPESGEMLRVIAMIEKDIEMNFFIENKQTHTHTIIIIKFCGIWTKNAPIEYHVIAIGLLKWRVKRFFVGIIIPSKKNCVHFCSSFLLRIPLSCFTRYRGVPSCSYYSLVPPSFAILINFFIIL